MIASARRADRLQALADADIAHRGRRVAEVGVARGDRPGHRGGEGVERGAFEVADAPVVDAALEHAGAHGRAANARRLVLTHIAADGDLVRARTDAEREFGAPIEIAHEGATYTI